MIKSEQDVADVLDNLHIIWEYEPRLFILLEDSDGHVKEGFRPDFYLIKYDLYIEVTMGKNANATAKNRKARRTRELYPGTKVEIIHRADFKNLKEKVLELVHTSVLTSPTSPLETF